MWIKKFNNNKGQLLIELLIVIGLAAILLPALLTGFVSSRNGKPQLKERDEAINLLKESEETVRTIRERGWDYLAPTGSDLHVVRDGNTWDFQSSPEVFGNFTRTIVINNVYRDSSNNIIPTGTFYQIDPSTKKVTVTVSWSKPISTSISSTTYLTRYLNNDHKTETTDTQFNNGTKTRVQITKDDNGEIKLAHGGSADWCSPGSPVVTHNLPGNGGADNGLAGNVIAASNRAFAGTGKNSSSYSFYNVEINNSSFPPSINLIGHYDSGGLKASDIFGEGDYAYIAPDKNSNQEILILNVSGASPSLIKTIDISGNKGSKTLFVSGSFLYFIGATNNKLYVYDITDRLNPVAKGNLNVGDVKKMFVLNDFVYLAMNNTTNQLVIIDATNKSSLKSVGNLTIGNNRVGVDVFVRSYEDTSGNTQTRAYLVTTVNPTSNNFYIINAKDPKNPTTIGSGYSTNPMNPTGITVIDNRAIIVGAIRPQYQVIKVDDDHYVWCASVPKTGDPDIDDINDVSSVAIGAHAYSYTVTSNTSKAFQIIEGGPGGGGTYVLDGVFESQPIDFGKDVVFNRFIVNSDTPSGTILQYQVAGADLGGSGCSNANYIFVGPDGTTNTKYDESGFITWNNDGIDFENPARCFKYKVYLSTSDTSKTPTLFDVSINYSP